MEYVPVSESHKEFVQFKRHLSRMRKEHREKSEKLKSKQWKDMYDRYNFAYQLVQEWMEKRDL